MGIVGIWPRPGGLWPTLRIILPAWLFPALFPASEGLSGARYGLGSDGSGRFKFTGIKPGLWTNTGLIGGLNEDIVVCRPENGRHVSDDSWHWPMAEQYGTAVIHRWTKFTV